MNTKVLISSLSACIISFTGAVASAQEYFPVDNGITEYHQGPEYRQSESHPLRIAGYVLHPVGWVLREVIFRPFSWLASSSEETRSVFGYRDSRDYRSSDCFDTSDVAPDCKKMPPFNYRDREKTAVRHETKEIYFPEVNFEFNKSSLNDLGRGRIHQLAALLQQNQHARIVLEGHTDLKGSDDYNLKLGLARAEAVRQELTALGVGEDRMSTVTQGKAQPELEGSEDWARAVNRRVEVRVN
jgi:outer membrane protein OmpA-like peptidoglycan-associated protein